MLAGARTWAVRRTMNEAVNVIVAINSRTAGGVRFSSALTAGSDPANAVSAPLTNDNKPSRKRGCWTMPQAPWWGGMLAEAAAYSRKRR